MTTAAASVPVPLDVAELVVRELLSWPVHTLGPVRLGDGAAPRVQRGHRHPGLLLRPGQPLATRQQRNTNGVLRQYFPKSTDLAVHSGEDLAAVAAEPNGRPRQTLGWDTQPSVWLSY